MQDLYLRSNVYEIDLSTEKLKIFNTPVNIVKAYLGGRGLNMYYLYKYLKPDTDPLSPENVLIFGTGLLTGSGVPNSGRLNISAKSPESGILGDTNCGGFFGPELRFAGADRLIIKGRAEKPIYIYIEDGNLEIRDAKEYWGLNTLETQKKMREDLGKDIQVACIGQAGENLVRFASIINGVKNSASRGGMGAVMGSKNIKAVVAKGSLGIPIKYPEKFVEKVCQIKDYLYSSKIIHVLGRVGTPLLYEVSNFLGAIRTKNSQLNAFKDTLNAEVIHQFVEKMISCYGCIVHCRHRNFTGEGPEYTTIGLLGANLGISKTEEVIMLNNLCNDLGLDVSSTGTIIAWAIELFEKGYLDEKSAGYSLKFGDSSIVKSLIIDISRRQGLGNILAESTHAVEEFGEETKDFLIAVKNLPQSDPHDCRYLKSFALGIATASRGADHLRSRPTLDIFELPEKLTKEIYGTYINSNPTAYETKADMVYFHEKIYSVIDSLGICKFICHGFNSPHLLKYEHFSDLIHLVTGLEISESELNEVACRILDLERMINMREGISRKDDTLPKRYFDEHMKLRLTKGHKIDRNKFQEMLSRYYELHKWDENGLVPNERVRELESYYS
ncbi:MAG: aldehyde ferredoxin oxidoreductase family protein [Candidatus Aminicenantia bacterium]